MNEPRIPIYVVSGYMRSGTSMMMNVLEKCGMNASYIKDKDRILNEKFTRSDYHPNPDGFYELGRKEFNDPEFISNYKGKLIKALHWRLKALPSYAYRIIFMLRDPKEIEVSYLKMFRQRPPFVLSRYYEFIKETLDRLSERSDMEITTIWYKDMLDDPVHVVKTLACNGFPIVFPENALLAVNPGLYRSKADDLNKVRDSIPGLRTDIPDFLKP